MRFQTVGLSTPFVPTLCLKGRKRNVWKCYDLAKNIHFSWRKSSLVILHFFYFTELNLVSAMLLTYHQKLVTDSILHKKIIFDYHLTTLELSIVAFWLVNAFNIK